MAKKKKEPSRLSSVRGLQRIMPRVLRALGKDPQLSLAAAANPLLALEALGYSLTDRASRQIERHARFGPAGAARLVELESSIFEIAGRRFDLRDPEAVRREIEPLLLEAPAPKGKRKKAPYKKSEARKALAILERPLPPVRSTAEPEPDPLEPLGRLHPVLPPLVEHRKLERSQPRFSSREVFERVRQGELNLPVTKLRFRLQKRAQRKAKARTKA